MKQKEYEIYTKLADLTCYIRNNYLFQNIDKELVEIDNILESLEKLQKYDMDKKYRELIREGITHETKIVWKKSVPTTKKLLSRCEVGSCIYVEDISRYYIKGAKKWIHLPNIYVANVKTKGNRISEVLFQEL